MLAETVVQTDESGTQPLFAGQIITIVQGAAATARASQHGSANILGTVGSASQSNRVRVDASAVTVADADQRIIQGNEQGSGRRGTHAGRRTVGRSAGRCQPVGVGDRDRRSGRCRRHRARGSQ